LPIYCGDVNKHLLFCDAHCEKITIGLPMYRPNNLKKLVLPRDRICLVEEEEEDRRRERKMFLFSQKKPLEKEK